MKYLKLYFNDNNDDFNDFNVDTFKISSDLLAGRHEFTREKLYQHMAKFFDEITEDKIKHKNFYKRFNKVLITQL